MFIESNTLLWLGRMDREPIREREMSFKTLVQTKLIAKYLEKSTRRGKMNILSLSAPVEPVIYHFTMHLGI